MVQKLPDNICLDTLFNSLKCDKTGIKIMSKKQKISRFLIKNIRSSAANILKQDALSVGAEFAVPQHTITCKEPFVDGVLMATNAQLERLIKKESIQPFGLKEIANKLKNHTIRSDNKIKIMGVLNINSDSFAALSRTDEKDLLFRIEKMIEQGADIIDIGALSSRPNSEPISEEAELNRIKKSLDLIRSHEISNDIKLSIDSYAPKVLSYALDCGFTIINDITGGRDPKVLELASRYSSDLIIMHMQNDPKTMQDNPQYRDVVAEIDLFFSERIQKAKDAGVTNIILDVGIGFGKTLEHNLTLINAQNHFLHHGCELLIGASRKSLIDKIFASGVDDRLAGSLAIHLKAVENGATIVRTHDPYEHAQALAVINAIDNQPFI